jgi:diguanylate cyclase (GGDEF)-like protein
MLLPLIIVLLLGTQEGSLWMASIGTVSVIAILINPYQTDLSGIEFTFSFASNYLILCAIAMMAEYVRKRAFDQELKTQTELKTRIQEIEGLQAELELLAAIDSLTGLCNRRALDQALIRELARAERKKHPVCLLMIDIDNFKMINDTYGHQSGDTILVEMGKTLKTNIRRSDVGCRWGGDEFIMLFPECNIEDSLKRAGEIKEIFKEKTFNFSGKSINMTLSIGLACYPDHGVSAEELIHAADHAMYRAKATRNLIMVAPERNS